MTHRPPEPSVPNLPTTIPGVELRELTDREPYFDLVSRNREHLIQFRDYEDLAASTFEDIEAYFANPPDSNVRMGIWRKDELMGRVDRLTKRRQSGQIAWKT